MLKIYATSVLVDDQAKALKFYTEKLGFEKKTDIPVGEYRWLTLVSPAAPDGVELLLEPLGFEPARVYQKALFESGIPCTSFSVDDIDAEHTRLTSLGVKFQSEPVDAGMAIIAVFDDTCGNLVQIAQIK